MNSILTSRRCISRYLRISCALSASKYVNKYSITSINAFSTDSLRTATIPSSPTQAPVDTVLYRGHSNVIVGVMFSVTTLNFLYWTYYIASAYLYKDVIISGINLGGDPIWGALGAFGTGLMCYGTRAYAHHSVYKAYETADGRRLGLQMYTILGLPGRKIEFSHCNVRKANVSNYFGSSLIPLRVKNVNYNVLIDKTGTYYEDNKLLHIIDRESDKLDSNKSVSNYVDTKEDRKQWIKQTYSKIKK